MQEMIDSLLSKLKTMHKEARCELKFSNPLELLVATILSAQCTDERVNSVTEKLFKKYRSLDDYIQAKTEELEEDIRPTGFYRNKAKAIKEVLTQIKENFSGRIPDDVEILSKMKGIGRKSANMIAGCAFGRPAVIVDTHVRRVAKRLGITSKDDPEKIERDIKDRFPMESWLELSLLLILHGRYICKARKPNCKICDLKDMCKFYLEGVKDV